MKVTVSAIGLVILSRNGGERLKEERIPKPGQIYRHFKNNLYQIITVATHWETGEKMVVYQALYGNFKTYVRPLEIFIGEVDENKYPEVRQKYRFEQAAVKEEKETLVPIEDGSKSETRAYEEEGVINPVLLEFLDAHTYKEKLDILLSNKKHINDKTLNDMTVSLDCTVEEGDLEERIRGFTNCLQTFARFENNRLR